VPWTPRRSKPHLSRATRSTAPAAFLRVRAPGTSPDGQSSRTSPGTGSHYPAEMGRGPDEFYAEASAAHLTLAGRPRDRRATRRSA
jgi:hypothetical protein